MKDVTAIKRRKDGQWVEETAAHVRNGGGWKKRYGVYAGGEWYVPGSKYSLIRLAIGEKSVNLPLEYGFIKETGNRLYIDWGDGSKEETTLVGELAIAHTYTQQGEYVIKTYVDEGTYQFNLIGMDIYYGSRPSNGTVPDQYIGTDFYDIREVVMGLGIKKIPIYAFGNLPNLHKVTLFEVEELDDFCFARSNLTELLLGNKVRIFKEFAVDYISRFTQLILPVTVESIGLIGCFVSELIAKPTIPPNSPSLSFSGLTIIKVPAASVEAYKAAPGWSKYADIISAI